MTCQKCNFQNADSAIFCGNCGTKLIEQSAKPHKTKKKAKPLWIMAGIVVVAVCAVLVLYNSTEKVQLLESITIIPGDRVETIEFEYDKLNRITKFSAYDGEGYCVEMITLTYFGDDLVKKVSVHTTYRTYADGREEKIKDTTITKFIKNGNKITETYKYDDGISTYTTYLDSDEYPVKQINKYKTHHTTTYIYDGGELTKILDDFEWRPDVTEYKYDKKKSPFYYCKTPRWYLIVNLIDFGYLSAGMLNNIIYNNDSNGGATEIKYEYDKAGFPTKAKCKWQNEYSDEYYEILYKYK